MLADYALPVAVLVMSFFGSYVFREVHSKYMCDSEKSIKYVSVSSEKSTESMCVHIV